MNARIAAYIALSKAHVALQPGPDEAIDPEVDIAWEALTAAMDRLYWSLSDIDKEALNHLLS